MKARRVISAHSRAWVLNFDADEELEDANRYVRARALARRFPALVERVSDLIPEGDLVLPLDVPGSAAGRLGQAFCPTESARRTLTSSQAVLPKFPETQVIRAVNSRFFNVELGLLLERSAYVQTLDDLAEFLADKEPRKMVLKRDFGFAGRGQLRLPSGELDQRARSWARAALEKGGLTVEPWVNRVADFGLHGYIQISGELSLGAPTKQTCDNLGVWQATYRCEPDDLSRAEATLLREEAERVATALFRRGYFGPFGIDAFRYVDDAGLLRFNPRCEVNARYSMGWATGMGDLRPDLALDE